jgi:hypothetical protein
MSKFNKDLPEEVKVPGCETCNNTGLEQGVALSEAKACPVCKGSPFEPRKEK